MPKRRDIQFAALPWRIGEHGRREVMLLTSRETRRWVIPKGWPMKTKNPAQVAKQEAFEEAGLVGEIVGKRPLGSYHYSKKLKKTDVLTEVLVYSFRVKKQAEDWPEKLQRDTRWWMRQTPPRSSMKAASPASSNGLLEPQLASWHSESDAKTGDWFLLRALTTRRMGDLHACDSLI